MEAWAEVLKVWEENIDEIAIELKASFDRDASQKDRYSLEDLRQIMRGGIAMMGAEAESPAKGTEVREGYLASIVPGLFDQGLDLAGLSGVTIEIAMRVLPLIVNRLSPDNKSAGSDFVVLAYRKYMYDTVRVGLDVRDGKY